MKRFATTLAATALATVLCGTIGCRTQGTGHEGAAAGSERPETEKIVSVDSLPADDVAEYQPRWRSHRVDSTRYRKVFLAGTIDMGQSEEWQAAVIARFRDSMPGRWLFFNPRRKIFHPSSEEMEYQVTWELRHLEAADLILMNLLGSSKSPVSLLELGLHARSGRLRVACDPAYYRYDNVHITCRQYDVPFYDSFEELLDELAKEEKTEKQD